MAKTTYTYEMKYCTSEYKTLQIAVSSHTANEEKSFLIHNVKFDVAAIKENGESDNLGKLRAYAVDCYGCTQIDFLGILDSESGELGEIAYQFERNAENVDEYGLSEFWPLMEDFLVITNMDEFDYKKIKNSLHDLMDALLLAEQQIFETIKTVDFLYFANTQIVASDKEIVDYFQAQEVCDIMQWDERHSLCGDSGCIVRYTIWGLYE